MTREEYVENVLYSMSEESIRLYFGVTSEELENGAWNESLEFGYGLFIEGLEDEEEELD